MASRSERMYKDSPSLKRDEETGKMKVEKKKPQDKKVGKEDNAKFDDQEGMDLLTRHRKELEDLHTRHQSEYQGIYSGMESDAGPEKKDKK